MERKSGRRLVVKVGSSSITDDSGGLSFTRMERIVHQLAVLQHSQAWEVVMVSSGALAAGRSKLGWVHAHLTQSEKQAAAAVGQTVLMHTYEQLFQREHIKIGQFLLTGAEVTTETGRRTIQNALNILLVNRILPIFNENDAVVDNNCRLGNNDTLASLIAILMRADQLILLTDTNGLHAADPRLDRDAALITDVWEVTEEIERMAGETTGSFGTGGMRTKVEAARFAMNAGTDVIVASSEVPDVLLRIARNESVGTLFHARSDVLEPAELLANGMVMNNMALNDMATLATFWSKLKEGARHAGSR